MTTEAEIPPHQTPSPRPPGTLVTLGYRSARDRDRLDLLMQRPGTLLLDIRYSPRAPYRPEWSRRGLSARYGEQYRWDKRLGNVNYRARELGIRLADGHATAIEEVADLVRAGTDVILLCACEDASRCHRMMVAQLVQANLSVLEKKGRREW